MTTAADKHSPMGALQRGKACLRCRKRKMRCDGVKPACQQCHRAKKADGCEYDDGKGKTRTQLLRERIELLEKRIKELEDPEALLPSVVFYEPASTARLLSESSSSGYGSPVATDTSMSHSPGNDAAQSPDHAWLALPGFIGPSSPMPDDLYDLELKQGDTTMQPSVDLARMLIDLFAPHRYQCGLHSNLAEIRDSVGRGPKEQRHPVLLNAIYLWACFLSRPEVLCQHEDFYLNQALDALRLALRHGEHVLDIIEGSCLLATYFFANGRIREGSFHSGAASSLAVQYQLHQGVLLEHAGSPSRRASFSESNTRERVAAFWQVFNLDRCWSVILRKPATIPDGPDPWTTINCPWPKDDLGYEPQTQFDLDLSFRTVTSFFDGDLSPSGFSPLALRAKASALFERAHHLSLSWDPRATGKDPIGDKIRLTDATIVSFIGSLHPLQQLESVVPEAKHLLVASYLLAHTATILLFRRFAKQDAVSYEKCLRAAKAMTNICAALTVQDYALVDPILGHCLGTAADPLIHELNNRRGSAWSVFEPSDTRSDLTTLLFALSNISSKFPVFGVSAAKIQAQLTEM